MDFFERRDMMAVMCASLSAAASQGSHFRIDPSTASGVVSEREDALYETAFPYMPKHQADDSSGSEGYDKYFDELDEIIAEEEREKAASSDSDGARQRERDENVGEGASN